MIAVAIKWIVVAMSVLNAGYMAWDGGRALVVGDYIRPQSGEYAGQLGPWTKVVTQLGIDPMSVFMKSVFLVSGLAGLVITTAFALDVSWGWKALLIFNVCCLWNLYFGTASSVVQSILLLVLRAVK